MSIHWKRTLRTESSERFIGIRAGIDIAAADIHYLRDGRVAGTMTLLADQAPSGGWTQDAITEVLRSLDDGYLPDVDVDAGNLMYTVVVGKVEGNFESVSE